MVSQKCTGAYRFIIEFYGLTDISAAIQKVMYNTLIGLKNTHYFLEHINIVSQGSKHDHLKSGEKSLEKLDEDNLRINLPKCHFARTEIEWLAYKFSQSAISTVESKTSAFLILPTPKTLKQLRSFVRLVNYLGKFIHNVSQLCH